MISLPPASPSRPTVTCGLKVPSVPGSGLALTENFISNWRWDAGFLHFPSFSIPKGSNYFCFSVYMIKEDKKDLISPSSYFSDKISPS